MKEVWHIFPLFPARKVGTNPLYFLGIVDVRDDGSTGYLAWHDRNQGGKEFLEEKPFFSIYTAWNCFVLFSSYLNSLKTILNEREGFLGKHCVLSAIFQGLGTLLTAFCVFPERHQLGEEGLHLIDKKLVCVCVQIKRAANPTPLSPFLLARQITFSIRASPAAAAFKQVSLTPAVVADLLWIQNQALSFQIPSLHPFIPTAQRKWKMKVNCFLHLFRIKLKQMPEVLWKWKVIIIF